MDKDKIKNYYISNHSGVNGAIIGLIFSVLILLIGVINTLFIVVSMIIGYYFGKKLTVEKDYIKKLLDKILPPGTYR